MKVSRGKSWLAALVGVFLLNQVTLGSILLLPQEKPGAGKSSTEADLQASAREQQRFRVLAALRAVADGAREWNDPGLASKVQAQIADLMWDADPDSARSYLIKAWETAGKVEDLNRERSRFRNSSLKTDARREVILIARKRAPDLSRKWLYQLAQAIESDSTNQQRGSFDDRTVRSTVLLQLAIQACETNPAEAAALATESLNDGISFGFQEVLLRIQEKDPDLAMRTFRAALASLQTIGMLDPNELLILRAYLYTPGRTIAANTGEDRSRIQLAVGRNLPRMIAAAQLNPALAAEFLNVAADLLIKSPLPSSTADPTGAARAQISVISALIGMIGQVSPEKAAILATRIQALTSDAQFSAAASKPPEGHLETKPKETASEYNERRVEYLEKLAERETTTLSRDIGFARAALATSIDSYQRGWSVAGRIDDAPLREKVRNWLTYRLTLSLLSSNNLERAYDLVSKNTDHLQRAASLVIGAQRLIESKETNRAAQWLSESRASLKRAEADENSVRVAFGVVAVYGKIDRMLAFDALSEAVHLMNKTNTALKDEDRAPTLQGFSGLDDATGDVGYGTRGFSLTSAIESFEAPEFEDTLAVISKIAKVEQRGLAIMQLCRKYLRSLPPHSAAATAEKPQR